MQFWNRGIICSGGGAGGNEIVCPFSLKKGLSIFLDSLCVEELVQDYHLSMFDDQGLLVYFVTSSTFCF